MTANKRKRVVVAMSGGVDSSVAAALLVEQGYDVIGMMMRLWSEESYSTTQHNRCCTPEQMDDARQIANHLGIPFYVLDTKDVFRNTIVSYFIDMHRQALTPNPCIECNRHIRFDYLYKNAMALDADYLATGHYARITYDQDTASYQLRKGIDEHKDQSYVLSVMTQTHLANVLFPVGELPKPEVRRIAEGFGLSTFSKKDSQDLCFLGDGDYRRFLNDHAADVMRPGPIVLRSGEVIGEHQGLANYTIGQRKGLGVTYSEPLYVIATNPYRNALIVGKREDLGRDHLTAHRANWISGSPPRVSFRAEIKIRYKAQPQPGSVVPLEDDRFAVHFDNPLRDIAPGQGVVIYQGDVCLGSGIIERDSDSESK